MNYCGSFLLITNEREHLSNGWSLEVVPAPRKAAGRKNNNENQAAISNHPDAFVSSPFAILSLCLSAESSPEETVNKTGKKWKSISHFPGKCPNRFVIYVSKESFFLGNSHSPLVQQKGRVKLLLSYQLKLAKALQVLVVSWLEFPLLGCCIWGVFLQLQVTIEQ